MNFWRQRKYSTVTKNSKLSELFDFCYKNEICITYLNFGDVKSLSLNRKQKYVIIKSSDIDSIVRQSWININSTKI